MAAAPRGRTTPHRNVSLPDGWLASPDLTAAGLDKQNAVLAGLSYDFKVVKMNEAEKKIGLSLRAVAEDEEKTRLEDYHRQAAAATQTMEEAMNKRKGDGR